MAKVDLSKVRLAVTAITKTVVATIPSKDGITMLHKQDVHSDFLRCILDFGKDTKFNIAGEKGEDSYQVAVVKQNGYNDALFARKKVIELLKKAATDKAGKTISWENWIRENLK